MICFCTENAVFLPARTIAPLRGQPKQQSQTWQATPWPGATSERQPPAAPAESTKPIAVPERPKKPFFFLCGHHLIFSHVD